MVFLLIIALCINFLEARLIVRQYEYIQKLVGARAELKEENRRLRESAFKID